MRILKFLSFSLIGLLALGFLSFFFGREILLVWGASTIKGDYNHLLTENFADECSRQFSYGQDYSTQIRFTSEKEYNLEVVCADFTSTPIVLASKKLPPLLYKKSFGSGFTIDDQNLPFFVKLSSLGREIFIYTDNKSIYSNYLSVPDLDYEQGPFSSCQSHSYQCCNSDTQSGVGNQLNNVNDCPKSCYESCSIRPNVLSFNSRPALDDSNRTVAINSGETITFSYILGNGKTDVFEGQISKEENQTFLEKLQTIFSKTKTSDNSDGIALPVQVTIDFGDGEFFSEESLYGSVDHSYSCQNNVCYFQAKILVKDAHGVLSADNELAKMIIKVNKL